jgi:hypothetical protein
MKKQRLLKRMIALVFACILLLSVSVRACFVIGDLNGDCQIDIDDLVLMASQWIGPSCGSESGLVLYWKLNESSGPAAADSSVAGHGGSVVGASWNPEGGILGGALQFDGIGDYVWSSYQGILGSDPRTCAAWIKTAQPSGQIMTWGDLDIDSRGWGISLDQTGVLRVDVGGGSITGTTVLADDFWHHIAVTSGGSTTNEILLYVDGRIETVGNAVSQSINTGGIKTVNMGNDFEGLIDDVRIYNRQLSLKKVWALFSTATINYACADLNADEIVNLSDISRLAQNWLQDAPPVIISEFLADNESKSPLGPGEILDGNGESSDWIEIHNNSGIGMDIGGWYLTDDSGLKTKWQFPAGMPQLVLQPGDYLIVFASGKTQVENPGNYPYVDPAGHLHTNFSLSNNGEYLGLIDSDGVTPVHEYNHINLGGGEYGYPAQEADISYGYYYDQARYFSVPTPSADNVKSPFEAFVEKPDVNFKGGCYVAAVDVAINCGTPGAFIRYTTDGTVPSLTNGLEYVGPIHLENLTTLIAKAFKPGLQPSDVRIETYIFVDSAVASFNSNLPIVVIDTLGVPIPFAKNQAPEVQYIDYRAVIIDTDDVTGRADITGPEHFSGIGQIRYRGESSYQTPDYGRGRGQYAFEIQDEYHQDKEVSLLGMPPESDWILNSEFVDRTMLKGYIAFKWFRDMGHYAPRQRFVEVYINEDGGEISTSDYRGIFGLREKIKRDQNRVDIARLDTSHNLPPKVSGGFIIKHDKPDFGDVTLNLETSPSYGITIDGVTTVVEPRPLDITAPQKEWIQNYINEFHSVLWQNTASSFYPGPQAVYTDYIDPIHWIDDFLVGEAGYDKDVFRYSSFAYKDRDGKLCAGPPWDFDRGFHARLHDVFEPPEPDRIPWRWHMGLQQNPEYRILLADRWFEHREDVFNTAQNMVHIDQTVALISEAMARTITVFGYTYDYATEITSLKDWITNRLNWLDGYIASNFAERPPIFSRSTGYVNPGDNLYLTAPAGVSGDIYYTLNGEDPRLEGGGLNSNAVVYNDGGSGTTETVTIVTEDAAKAVLVPTSDIGTDWTGGAEPYSDGAWTHGTPTINGKTGGVGYDENATYVPYITYDLESLMNNTRETCYIRIPFTADADDVANVTSMTLRIRYDDGFRAYLNGTEIASQNAPASPDWDTGASAQHGDSTAVNLIDFDCSVYINSLQAGDNILAIRGFNRGTGSSDFLISAELVVDIYTPPSGGPQITFDKSKYVKARIKNGSDWSAVNTEVYAVGPVLDNLRISEIMYHPADPNAEFIELQNVGAEAINLNLVHFTDGIDYTFGDYSLAAGAYVLVVENQTDFEAKYGAGLPIAGQYIGSLDNNGEEIVLRDAIGAEIHDFDYKDGWYELTDGLGYSLTMVDPAATDPNLWDSKVGWRSSLYAGGTPGQAPETVLAADSIVINELLSHSHGTEPDWIELYNTTGQDINIGGWFLSDDDSDPNAIRKYQIPDNTVISAGGYHVFVGDVSFDDPAPVGSNIPFGLSEGGETVYLYSGTGGEVTGLYQTQQTFDAAESGITFGRYEKAELSGGYDFVRQSSSSQGTANNSPLIPAVVMTEIYYNPPSGGAYEFVELYNRSGSPVTLMSEASTETSPGVFISENIPWRLEGTGFEFPTNTTIPADTRILVAKTPALYSSAPCAVYGPYDGALDNGGEEIEIQVPGDQEYGQLRYWIPIEKIDYDDVAPWPTSADGGGDSLNRNNINAYSRDYSNWNAATPTPGS